MDEARGRFIEGAKITIEGLRTGVVDNPEGEFYPQSRVEIRPAPNPTYEWGRDRLFGAAMSPDSVPVIADLGVRMMTFMQFEFEKHAETINRWRDLYRERWGTEPLPPVIQDFVICHEDAEEARRLAYEHVARYFLSVIKHYDFAGEHWRNTKGYETYQVGADMIREAGMEPPPTPTWRRTSTARRSRSSRSTRPGTRRSATSSPTPRSHSVAFPSSRPRKL